MNSNWIDEDAIEQQRGRRGAVSVQQVPQAARDGAGGDDDPVRREGLVAGQAEEPVHEVAAVAEGGGGHACDAALPPVEAEQPRRVQSGC